MNSALRTKANWTKLVIAFLLVFGLFGFGAMAQTNSEEPLDAKAVTALIEELTDGLPDLIEDEAVITAITEKWEAREDLAGKTRTQILKILFADVKSVIDDQDTQENIWKNWTEEEKSEDEAPVDTPQPPATPPVATPQAPPPPAKPVEQSSCRARTASIVNPNQAERHGFISVAHRLLFATGTVRCFDEKKGFGFITQDGDGADIFVHHSAINMDGFRTLQEGQKVQFEVVVNAKGQRSAVNVRPA